MAQFNIVPFKQKLLQLLSSNTYSAFQFYLSKHSISFLKEAQHWQNMYRFKCSHEIMSVP